MAEQAKCRSCKAAVVWLRTASTGKFIPLDAEPFAAGNIVVKDDLAHVLTGSLFEPVPEGPRYRSHFATCPNAAKHRGRN